jgi:hypothetical protein
VKEDKLTTELGQLRTSFLKLKEENANEVVSKVSNI